ncbi:MAG: ABC transporter ATP-binding protein/permease [Bacilli bacterium]|nr:ABC transporter ATP-binding protein/permease [Bacilli bacterium]
MKSLSLLKKYRFKVILAPTLKLFEVAAELFSPFLVRYIIDKGIKNKDWEFTWRLSLILFGIAILGFLFTMGAQYLSARVASDYCYDLRKEIFSRINSISEKQLDSFGKQRALTLVNNDAFMMQNAVNMFMRLIFRPPFLLVGASILSFLIDWRTGLIFVGALTGSAIIIAIVMIVSPKRYAAIQSSLDEISLRSHDSLTGAKPVRAFNQEDYESEKFGKSVETYTKRSLDMAKWNSLINPLTFFFVNLALILVVYLGNISTPEGSLLTTGEIVSLISYLTSSLGALVMFSRMIVSLNKAAASKKRIDSFFEIVPDIVNEGSEKGNEKSPLVEFRNVSLTYGKKGEKPAVSGLSFTLEKGQWIGLIGGTGSGKTTTLSLLLRLYDPTEGEILYKGVPLQKYDLNALRKEISIVLQKSSIFRGTIRSNLLIARSDATEGEMIKALKDSLAYEYVSKWKEGLDYEVEEGGTNLSGGQRQRLLIARALLAKGEILILDDSTSALDYLSDQKVRANISKINGLTKIIVSQRATSLKDCDQILVYDNGQIVANGTHETLVESCDIYKEIYEMQKGEGR